MNARVRYRIDHSLTLMYYGLDIFGYCSLATLLEYSREQQSYNKTLLFVYGPELFVQIFYIIIIIIHCMAIKYKSA